MATNSLALIISITGTSFFMRKIGILAALATSPAVIGIFLLLFISMLQMETLSLKFLLWSLFSMLVVLKALGYAINSPAKEAMYNPTST